MRFTLSKNERLKSKKQIEFLFAEGKTLHHYPLRLKYVSAESSKSEINQTKVAFSVPKRRFNKAVERNRIKRLMRECYRLQKNIIYDSAVEPHILMILYIGKEEPTYKSLYQSMQKLLTKFTATVQKEVSHEDK